MGDSKFSNKNRRLVGTPDLENQAPQLIDLPTIGANDYIANQTVIAREGHVFVFSIIPTLKKGNDDVIDNARTTIHQLVDHDQPLAASSWKLLFELNTPYLIGNINKIANPRPTPLPLEYADGTFYFIQGWWDEMSLHHRFADTYKEKELWCRDHFDVKADPLTSPRLPVLAGLVAKPGDQHVELGIPLPIFHNTKFSVL